MCGGEGLRLSRPEISDFRPLDQGVGRAMAKSVGRCPPLRPSRPPRSSFSGAIAPCAHWEPGAQARCGSRSTSGTDLDVALKIIAREGKAAARAEREAMAARRLRHDRCVRAYDVGHDPSHVYIAYEYVPGRTLRETIRAGALTDRDAVEIAAQVLDALAHAHRTGIVHRDVKPANILVEDCDDLSIRLLDFGLAQFDGADTLTAVGDVPGTLAYIAPERLDGSEATPQSDVWSVGVLLWETLSERHPFWGVPIQEVARAIQAGRTAARLGAARAPAASRHRRRCRAGSRSGPSPERLRSRRRAAKCSQGPAEAAAPRAREASRRRTTRPSRRHGGTHDASCRSRSQP